MLGVMRRLGALLVCLAAPLCADDLTQRMAARLAEEADAFRRLAPQVLGEETLLQRAEKPPPRFRPRVGKAATAPPQPVWQQRQIVSEYGFGTLGGEQGALHELRQVISVDAKKVRETGAAQRAMARILALRDEAKEKELLKEFEKAGLVGAATDFGQLLLLFTPRDIGRYEFTALEPRLAGATPALVFGYRQTDGPQALTVFEAGPHEQATRMRMQGEVWVRQDNLLPLRITLAASREGAGGFREEASVDYAMSSYGALLPSGTEQKELRGGKLVVQNLFSYGSFRKFGASSELRFDVEP
jgi:hypothetical protein